MAGCDPIGIARSTADAAVLIDALKPDCVTLNFELANGPSTSVAETLVKAGIPFILLSNDNRKAQTYTKHKPLAIIDKFRQSTELGQALVDLRTQKP